jgi:DNA repair exonuclease SbcCD ATPase subunit
MDHKLINSNDDLLLLFMDNIKLYDNEIKNLQLTNDDILDIIKNILNDINYEFQLSTNTKLIKLNSIKFSNLFSYNENNCINFNNFNPNKIIGLNALNFSGKSSIIDSILFALYNKTSRGNKIQNINKNNYSTKVNLNTNNDNYEIIRKGKLENDKLKTTILINKNGKPYSLLNKTDYNKEVLDIITNYDNFINSSIIFQNNQGFIDLNDEDRKNLLFKIFNLDIFQILYKRIKLYLKDNNFYYKKLLEDKQKYNNVNIYKISKLRESYIQIQLNHIQKIKTIYENEYLKLLKNNKQIKIIDNYDDKNYNKDINILSTSNIKLEKLKNILNELIIKKENIENIINNFELNNDENNKLKNDLKNITLNSKINYYKINKINNITNNIIDNENIIIIFNKYINEYNIYDIIKEKEIINLKIDNIKNKILFIKNNLNTLNNNYLNYVNYEFDPKCSYCVKNNTTKEKLNIESNIKIQKNVLIEKQEKLNKLLITQNEFKNYNDLINNFYKIINIIKNSNELNYKIIKNNYNKLIETINIKNNYNIIKYSINGMYIFNKNKYSKINNCISYVKNIIKELKINIKNIEDKTNSYIEYINNKDYIIKCNEVKNKIDEYTIKYSNIFENLVSIKIKNATLEEKEKFKIELINKIKIQEKQVKILSFIKKLITKYNIFNNIINNILNIITTEINNILTNITNFTIDINYNNNVIEINKNNIIDNNKKLNVKLLCGFEKESLNLIFKIVLNKLNMNFKTNFLIIDEGFTSYDKIHLETLNKLFEYIKQNYDWCLIITHIDSLKKYIDKFINIQTIDNYSHIEC